MLHRKLAGDDWDRAEHLLAIVADQLAAANWQRAGKRSAPKPKPISPLAKAAPDPTRVGNANGRSPEEVLAALAAHRNGAPGG